MPPGGAAGADVAGGDRVPAISDKALYSPPRMPNSKMLRQTYDVSDPFHLGDKPWERYRPLARTLGSGNSSAGARGALGRRVKAARKRDMAALGARRKAGAKKAEREKAADAGNGALPPVGGAEGSAQKGTSSRGAGEAAELARELRRARQELETVRRHADFNSAAAAKEISRLCAALAAAREANASAEGQVLEQAHALDELRREAAAESSAQGRMGLAAERRAAQAAQRLHESREEHSRAVDESARKLNAARRERNALVAALAGVAEAAMVGSTGGDPSATETIIAEARDAQDAGNEPLPRRRDAWAAFKYGEDERASREGAHAGSNAWRGSDGSRAIAALRAAVQRLHRRRAEARDEREVAQEEAAQLRQVLARVDDEYQSVADRVGDLEARLEVEAKKREVQPPGRTGTLAERVGSVVHCAALLGAAADEADNEKRALVVRLLELEFFSKLQEGLSKEDDEVANPDDGNKAILV